MNQTIFSNIFVELKKDFRIIIRRRTVLSFKFETLKENLHALINWPIFQKCERKWCDQKNLKYIRVAIIKIAVDVMITNYEIYSRAIDKSEEPRKSNYNI